MLPGGWTDISPSCATKDVSSVLDLPIKKSNSLGKECFLSQLCYLEQWSAGQAEKCSQHHSGQDMCNAIIVELCLAIPYWRDTAN